MFLFLLCLGWISTQRRLWLRRQLPIMFWGVASIVLGIRNLKVV